MCRCDSQPSRIVHRLDRSRPKQLSLLACAADKPVSDSVNFVSTEDANDVVDLRHFFQQRSADSFRQAARNDDALRATFLFEVEHFLDDRLRFFS